MKPINFGCISLFAPIGKRRGPFVPIRLTRNSVRNIGPYRNYRYGGDSFKHNKLESLNIIGKNERRVRGQVGFWNYHKRHGIIIDDLTGEQYVFSFKDILGMNTNVSKLLVYRNVEFTPVRKSNFELVAQNVIDLGPSSYMPITGVTEKINYPTKHLENRAQWDGIPYWYHPVMNSMFPLCELPRVKPLIYKDAKYKGKY